MTENTARGGVSKTISATVVGLTATQASRVYGANDRVRIGLIGTANRGGQLMTAFLTHADMEIVALSDVRKSHMEKANERLGGKAAMYGDFRKLLEQKDIDAVLVATPDHWHAIMTIDACNAGKDVYCEKPTSATVFEGRRMVEAARRNQRVVTVGLHRRSSPHYAQMAELVQAGKIGKVTAMRMYHRSNMYPNGIGKAPVSEPPADLDWNLWLGPRPERPIRRTSSRTSFAGGICTLRRSPTTGSITSTWFGGSPATRRLRRSGRWAASSPSTTTGRSPTRCTRISSFPRAG